MNQQTRDTEQAAIVRQRALTAAKRAEFLYKFWKNYGVPIAFILICVFFAVANPRFISYSNIMNVIRQRAVLAMAAAGTTIIMIGGGIDLSIGSVVALTTCITLKPIAYWGWPPECAILLALGTGLFIGWINGLLTNKLGIPPLIATLGMMLIVRGTAYVFTKEQNIVTDLPDWFVFFGRGYIGPIPFQVFTVALVYAIAGYLMKGTIFGTHTYAVGSNRKSARLAGINVERHSIILFAIGGLTSALAGILLSARLGSGWAGHGNGYEFDIIAAILLGGTSIFGGKGNVFRTLIGVMLIGALTNGMNLLGISSFYQWITTGLILIIAIALERLRSRQAEV
jgi:ribose transport system permease protein